MIGVVVAVDPTLDEILAFCAEEPIERVFLEDIARRGLGRFSALAAGGRLTALCHVGANVVPTGAGCSAFAPAVVRGQPRMIIGEEGAVDALWSEAEQGMPRPRDDRPGQPVYVLDAPPLPGDSGLRKATLADLDLLVPACAAAHREEIGIDPMRRDPDGFRWRTRMQIEDGRSWLWLEDGVIRFKAEASAWTPAAVQLQQVWVDPQARNQRVRAARDARSVQAPARARPVRLPVRPARERRRHPRVRASRDAADDLVPFAHLLMLERIEAFIRAHDLIDPGGEVCCLVSGGADSTCLWHALGALGYRVSAVHVNHKLRGVESDEDARFCADILGAEVVELDGRGLTEAELREQRYSVARDQLRATGHTASDQVETILFRLVSRGSATGMAPSRPDGVVHPLLDLWRKETKAYCEAEGLPFRVDSSNADTKRGLIRDEILPLLRRLHPQADANILRALDMRETLAASARGAADLARRLEESRPRRRPHGRARVRPALARAGPDRPEGRGALGRMAHSLARGRP